MSCRKILTFMKQVYGMLLTETLESFMMFPEQIS